MRLKDRVAIVTGAAGGLGSEFSIALAREGAKIVAADLHSAEETIARIAADGGEAIGTETDVSNGDSAQKMADAALSAFGRIDILISNAGILSQMMTFDQITDEQWDHMLAVNAKGMWQCAKAVVPSMKAQGKGKIVNISSSTFYEGVPMMAHYVASKGAVLGFTRALARELTDTGINVNAITPGLTITPLVADQIDKPPMSEVRKHINAGRIIPRDEVPSDLSGTVVFLSSDESDFISGQTINVDGGFRHL